jgi:hypothetical protein
MQFVDLALRQRLHQRVQVQALSRQRQRDDFGAGRFERISARTVGAFAAGDQHARTAVVQQARRRRRAQPRVGDHTQWRRMRHIEPNRQLRVVGADGVDARQHGRSARAPAMAVALRDRASDRRTRPIGRRSASIQRRRQLHAHEGPAAFDARKESDVEFARRGRHQSDLDGDAGRAQARKAFAGDAIERIADGRDHTCDTGARQRIGTRRRPTMVCAGFEGDVGGGAACTLARFAQREHFRMRFAGAFVETATQHGLAAGNHATDARIRRRRVQAARGKPQRLGHVRVVEGVEHAQASGNGRGSIAITVAHKPRSDTVATSSQPSLR